MGIFYRKRSLKDRSLSKSGISPLWVSSLAYAISGGNTPPSLSNLVEWWDNRTADFGVTGATIDTWTGRQASNILTGTAPDRPSLVTVGTTNMTYHGGYKFFTLPGGFSTNQRASSVFIVMRASASASDTSMIYSPGSNATYDSLYVVGSLLKYWNLGNGNQSTSLYFGDNLCVLHRAASASAVKIGLNSQSYSVGVNDAGTLTGGSIGRGAGGGSEINLANIEAILVYDTGLSDAEIQAVQDWCRDTYKAASRTEAHFIAYVGDSLTEGVGSSNSRYWAYPAQIARLETTEPIWANLGVGGAHVNPASGSYIGTTTMTTQLTRFAGITNRTIVVDIGSNDLNAGRTAAQVAADLATYITAVKTADASAHVVLCTVLTRAFASQAAMEAERVTLNSTITGAGCGQDSTVDNAGDSRLQTRTNTTYFNGDEVHLTDAGYAAKAENTRAVLIANSRI